MPTSAELHRHGRADLCQMVKKLGGFPAVAQRVGLRTSRRPRGFWDNFDNLDHVLAYA